SMAGAAARGVAGPSAFYVSRAGALALMGGKAMDSLVVGTAGATFTNDLRPTETPVDVRNVVGILRGSDPALRNSFVAIGAHNDHVGIAPRAVDHDSLKAYNDALWALRAKGEKPFSASMREQVKVDVGALRTRGPARADSVYNGADDDGSGSMGVLEIAEAFAKAPRTPKRSLLFVWHAGEERGLLGALHFTDQPTVARDSIVAQLNIDMIGRGRAEDQPLGGPTYVGLVGSRRLSTELGDLIETINGERTQKMVLDYALDANGHPENIYCRSDHFAYARYGIPVAFFYTGAHADYHQLTDEPQYIDYPHYATITQFIHDIASRVANLDHRPVVDKPKPDPKGRCQQ
ncbi:MAG: M28 family peptidase, partial [Gemmatimonadaceae bacterium]|nr:M28 family peptidase [Gemmatimonadaceae bacterium]